MRRKGSLGRLTNTCWGAKCCRGNSYCCLTIPSLIHQPLQCIHVSAIVSRLVNRRLGNEGSMGQPEIVQQNAEWFFSNGSLPDMLMAVKLRSTRGLGVVAVDNANIVQPDSCVEMLECLIDAFFADDVIPGNVRVARVDARGDRHNSAQAAEYFCDLLEASAKRKLRASSVFDEDRKAALRQIKASGGSTDCGSSSQQPLFAVRAAKRSRMQHEILGTQRQRAFHFAAKRFHRFIQKQLI